MKSVVRLRRTARWMAVVFTLAVALALPYTPEAAANKQAVTKIALEANSYAPLSQREFTDAQQIQRLLELVPTQKQLMPSGDRNPITGGVGVDMKIYRGVSGDPEEWFFTSQYAAKYKDQGAADWYFCNEEKWNLLMHLAGTNVDQFPAGSTFRGEKVTGLYTLDGKNFSYSVDADADIIKTLEKTPETSRKTGKLGYLLFTDKGRYEWYLPEKAGDKLADYALEHNKYNHLRRAQWLAYMNPEKIQSITYGGLGGKDYTLGSANETFGVSVEATNRDSIRRIAAYLKTIPVQSGGRYLDGMMNPSTGLGGYFISIKFKNGVEYQIMGSNADMSVSTTDLMKCMTYTVSENQIHAMRDFMSVQPEAKLTAWSES